MAGKANGADIAYGSSLRTLLFQLQFYFPLYTELLGPWGDKAVLSPNSHDFFDS